ncbi:peptidase T [Lactobacillus taiwanensis]|uniref:peptidase T n=1 Tax=Lactobacillus taiwanensis TaxID=508451 RepID=UPI000B990B11|nr:peptidase T [Lactobacillus taiwanensis]OYS21495.1 peptidase T [Lactobacillus taiwanensis]OYS21587.1 peptidase T [Lactobacillus taiwanensis]OYS22033.1 peptidase T [Lactobacillus taiwanensis]OYS27587.1 peptidase T [Lactobacillus taiwanensis]OYS30296.1 peptidase T [Lactobacillus taiwanensis]
MTKIDQSYIQDKFVEYCKVNTRSDEQSTAVPTTPGQVDLLKIIEKELEKLGLKDISFSEEDSYLVGKLSSTTNKEVTPIGFVAHVDTADFNSENIRPQVHKNYDGKDISLKEGRILSTSEFPSLNKHIGETLITADGSTLLGADDKAGIAGLLGMLKFLKENSSIEHGDVWVAFGPDEEIGKGAARFNVKRFPVEFAYTLDNGDPGDIAFETFNAAAATVDFHGTVVHPGEAYGLMVNAALMASEFIQGLPASEVPENSRDFDGYFMILSNIGNVDHAEIQLIIRDFDTNSFEQKKKLVTGLVGKLNQKYGLNRVSLKIHDQYRSPGDLIKQHPYVVNLVLHAYKTLGLKPKVIPFRGGTDGDFISEKGIPTPNLFNGGANFHGPYEYVTTESMALLAKTLVEIAKQHVLLNNHRDESPLKRKY